LAIELLSIVYSKLSGHAKSTDDLLPKELFDGGCGDSSEGSRLNPLGEIFNRDHNELEVALGCWQRPNDVHSLVL
jgi:hypothetical protein